MSESPRHRAENDRAQRANGNPVAESRPEPETRLTVSQALALAADTGVIEVYVGWPAQPVRVSSRPHGAGGNGWQAAAVLLRERVVSAIQPLLDNGWSFDGTPVSAMRWDTTHEHNGQDYEGCWVRLRSRSA